VDESTKFNRKEDIHTFTISTNNRYYTENKWILKDLFEKSLKAKHGEYSLFEIQFEILGYILAANSANKKYTRWKNLIAKALNTLVNKKAPKDRIIKAQNRLEFLQNSELATQFFIGQLRSIGDGIAWWFLDYDRAILRILTEHPYVSIPELGKGLEAEIYRCAELASEKIPFLLNTITNFLRIGDITIYDKSSDSYKLVEVKAGKMHDSRTLRQGKYLSLVQEALDTGSQNIADPEITHMKIVSKKPLLTYIKILENAMNEAKDKIISSRVFGEYLSFSICYLRKIIDIPSEYNTITESTFDRCFSIRKQKEDLILPVFTNILHTLHFSRMLAPYTIFPIEKELRFSLISGDFLLFCLINVHGLARWLRKRGWEVNVLSIPNDRLDFSTTKYLYVPILQVRRTSSKIGAEIPLDQICGAAMELWMPESIERSIQAVIDHGYSKNAYTVIFPNTGKYAWD
jgi:hypothetical protein